MTISDHNFLQFSSIFVSNPLPSPLASSSLSSSFFFKVSRPQLLPYKTRRSLSQSSPPLPSTSHPFLCSFPFLNPSFKQPKSNPSIYIYPQVGSHLHTQPPSLFLPFPSSFAFRCSSLHPPLLPISISLLLSSSLPRYLNLAHRYPQRKVLTISTPFSILISVIDVLSIFLLVICSSCWP